MSDREQVILTLRGMLPQLRREFGISRVALFGSVARDMGSPGSDVDVLLEFDPAFSVTLVTFSRIKTALEEALGRSVDVVEDHAGLRPSFRASIERDLVRVA